jgi:hypothetical protein
MGEDITANAFRFKGLPSWIHTAGGGFTGAIRFEAILTVEDWTVIDPTRSTNPRNAGTGIMRRKNGHQAEYLTIYAFDIDETLDGVTVPFLTGGSTPKPAEISEFPVLLSVPASSDRLGAVRRQGQDAGIGSGA